VSQAPISDSECDHTPYTTNAILMFVGHPTVNTQIFTNTPIRKPCACFLLKALKTTLLQPFKLTLGCNLQLSSVLRMYKPLYTRSLKLPDVMAKKLSGHQPSLSLTYHSFNCVKLHFARPLKNSHTIGVWGPPAVFVLLALSHHTSPLHLHTTLTCAAFSYSHPFSHTA
jgi:hypothetical protein